MMMMMMMMEWFVGKKRKKSCAKTRAPFQSHSQRVAIDERTTADTKKSQSISISTN